VCLFVVFSYGFTAGHYQIFPYENLKFMKEILSPSEKNTEIYQIDNNISSLISIQNFKDINTKKENIISFVWKNNGFPDKALDFEKNVTDNRYSDLKELLQIDKIEVDMDYGVDSKAYLFLAKDSNNKVIIYHQGHDGDFEKGKNTIDFFVKNGYNVLAMSMPLQGMNEKPIIDIPHIGKIKFFSHDQFRFLDNENFSSMKFFFEPIAISLNSMEENYEFDEYIFVGISGGGWTSTIYPTLDDRISKSFSVAGGLPIILRDSIEDKGDYEQTLPEFYRIANYFEFFIISSIGENRKHVQIFNEFDPCCYSGNKFEVYEEEIKTNIEKIGKGYFEIYLDSTHKEHKISEYSLNVILNEINDG